MYIVADGDDDDDDEEGRDLNVRVSVKEMDQQSKHSFKKSVLGRSGDWELTMDERPTWFQSLFLEFGPSLDQADLMKALCVTQEAEL